MIPQYLIERVGGMTFGYRHTKRPVHTWPVSEGYGRQTFDRVKNSALALIVRKKYHQNPMSSGLDELKDKLIEKDLEFLNWEFRFWAVESVEEEHVNEVGPMFLAVCRGCGTIATRKETRRNHLPHCASTVVEALKIMIARRQCGICGAHTVKDKFGFPLCSDPQCFHEFKYGEQPPLLLAALEQVENNRKMVKEG